MRTVIVCALIVLLSGLTACSSVNEVECLADGDCSAGQECNAGECVPATGDGDAGADDGGTTTDATNDTGAADVSDTETDPEPDGTDIDAPDADEDGGDATTDDASDVEDLLAYGEPCESDDACETAVCVAASAESVCSSDCDSGCPDDWSCRETEDRGDLCFPPETLYCAPCASDEDCPIDGHFCAELDDGDYCVVPCADACPEGSLCEQFGEGADAIEICTPDFDVCTGCFDADEDGFGVGSDCDVLELDCEPDNPLVNPGAEEVCNGEDDNCNGEADEGIDFGSIDHCGECGNACGAINADAFCETGECFFACFESFDDCDDDPENGCETDLRSPESCGSCGNECAFDNAETLCEDGACIFEACLEGFVDANEDLDDGCECEVLGAEDPLDLDGIDSNCDGVDGVIAESVYVATVAESGADGLTPDRPVGTIGEALEIAARTGRRQVLVTFGTYSSNQALAIERGNFEFVGGYGPDYRDRDGRSVFLCSSSYSLRIVGASASVYVAGFRLETGDAILPSFASIGVFISDSGSFVGIEDTLIIAGRGADGLNGANGRDGAEGNAARPATRPEQGSQGAGVALTERRGGDGAFGRSGVAGARGDDSLRVEDGCGRGGAGGGVGGVCASGGYADAAVGLDGQPGCDGNNGLDGVGGDGVGNVDVTFLWVAALPLRGEPGEDGGGGGGGGSGGGATPSMSEPTCVPPPGGGGGGGGQGGAGGAGGGSAGNGGASIGLLIDRATVTLVDVEIQTGHGGAGGVGGAGGRGGEGGGGAPGGEPTVPAAPGGDGGDGGHGGHGGCGGSGGGGPSVGIFGDETSRVTFIGEVSIELGSGGPGGNSPATTCESPDVAGADGLTEAVWNVEVTEF